MKSIFYHHAPKILAIIAVIYTTMGYLIDTIAKPNGYFALATTLVLVINVSGGIILGKLLQKSYFDSLTDSLTKVPNRRFFFDKLNQEISNFKTSISVLMIDVDDFKKINDTYGHPEGDKVLVKLGKILRKNIRASDTLARVGGEEFALIVPNINDTEAHSLAERIKKDVEDHDFKLAGKSEIITVSIGFFVSYDYIERDLLIKIADDALYTAKQTKNCAVVGNIGNVDIQLTPHQITKKNGKS